MNQNSTDVFWLNIKGFEPVVFIKFMIVFVFFVCPFFIIGRKCLLCFGSVRGLSSFNLEILSLTYLFFFIYSFIFSILAYFYAQHGLNFLRKVGSY